MKSTHYNTSYNSAYETEVPSEKLDVKSQFSPAKTIYIKDFAAESFIKSLPKNTLDKNGKLHIRVICTDEHFDTHTDCDQMIALNVYLCRKWNCSINDVIVDYEHMFTQ